MTALSVLFLLLTLLTWRWVFRTLRPSPVVLHPSPARADLTERVSIIVPMRNEECHVDACLKAIRAQSHPHLQVIVVDDASTDSTPRLLAGWQAQWPELEVVRLEGCPAGWAGKVHAMHRGVERARGEWVFFTDADVELEPEALACGLSTALANDWPVLSVVGRLLAPSFWEKAIQLPFSSFFLWAMVEMPQATLCGHYILMRRSLLDRVGGMAAIAGAVADDREMARLLRAHGVPFRAHLWIEAYRSRMFTSARDIWPGIRRMIAGTARFRPASVLGVALWILLTDLLPWAALGYGVTAYPQGARRALFWMVASASLLLARWFVYQRLLARLRAAPAAFLLKPLGDLITFLLYVDAALHSLAGSVRWRDRAYSRTSVEAGAQTTAAPPQPASSPPEERPPSRDGYCLSLVVETQTSGFWRHHDVNCDRAIAQFFRIAREHPEVEVIFVSDRELGVPGPLPPNLRILASPSPDYYQMKRYGMQQARAEVIAFADTDVLYPRDYIPRMLAPFDDPQVQIVAAKMRYPFRDARSKAACVRDWGHLGDHGDAIAHIPANAFAARRSILERYLFGLGFRRIAGEIYLYLQARMDGVPIHYLHDVVTFHENYYNRWSSVFYRMFEGIPATVDPIRRYLARSGRRAFRHRAFLRMLPVWLSLFLTVASLRRYPHLKAGLAVASWHHVSVPLWLAVLAIISLGVALRCVLHPRWFHRRAEEEHLTLSPDLDADPNHPLNLILDRVLDWLREDPGRLRRLFVPAPGPARLAPARPAYAAPEREVSS